MAVVAVVRTNIEIDDRLMAEAVSRTGLKTKRPTVEAGLNLLVEHGRRHEIADLFGKLPDWDGDLDLLRERSQARRRDDGAA